MKTFSLRLPGTTKYLVPGILTLLTLSGVAIPFASVADNEIHPGLFAVLWFAVLGYAWYRVLSLPQSIVLRDDGVLEFRSPLGVKEINISELISIEPEANQFGFFRVRHSRGSIGVLLQFDGFHQLAAAIKEENPRVKLLGC